jgi:hypothetical protein
MDYRPPSLMGNRNRLVREHWFAVRRANIAGFWFSQLLQDGGHIERNAPETETEPSRR